MFDGGYVPGSSARAAGSGGPMIGSVNVDARGMQDPGAVADYTGRHVGWELSKAGLRT